MQQNDVGMPLELVFKDSAGVVVDISSATTKEILLHKPGGAVLTKTATFTTNGTDGKIRFSSASGDWDQPGVYRLQGHIAGTGYNRYSSIVTMTAEGNLV